LTLSTIIYKTDINIERRQMALSTTIYPTLNKKI